MTAINSWVWALRPRTLFLAMATAICGNGIAYSTGRFNMTICVLTIVAATLLQLLSNMANDLSDYQYETDAAGYRAKPISAIKDETVSPEKMKIAITIALFCSIIIGGLLIDKASSFINIWYMLLLMILGILSVWAAIKYTVGKTPYGYKNMGDLLAFLFFGPIAVVGTYFLHVHKMSPQPWLPAIGMGLFTAAVLNVNNMRDMENDKNLRKMTLAIKLGISKSKQYHAFLSLSGISCFTLYSIIYSTHWYQNLYLISAFIFVLILYKIYKTKNSSLLDPYLTQTYIASFILAISFGVCINL